METATKLTSKPTRSTSFREAEDLTREPASKYRNIHLVGGGGAGKVGQSRVAIRSFSAYCDDTAGLEYRLDQG